MAATRLTDRTLLIATTLAATTLSPASAGAGPAEPEPTRSLLDLAAHEQGRAGGHRTAVVSCNPAGGTHPNPGTACAELAEADGNFRELRTEHHTACPMNYQPVTYTAKGTWRGKPVEYREKFPNKCVAAAHTGTVFQF